MKRKLNWWMNRSKRWEVPDVAGFFICAGVALLALSGCFGAGVSREHARPAMPSAPPDSGEVAGGQKTKDGVVLTEADAIEKGWPDAKPHTDAQRAAVAAAPASDVAAILAEWEAYAKAAVARDAANAKALADRDTIIAKLEKELREMRDAFHNWFRRGCYIVGTIVMALGVASFFLMGQIASFSPWLAARMGPMISLSIFAFGATLLATGIAYGWALEHKTAVACILGAAALAAGIYFHGNHASEKRAATGTP